MNIKYEKGVSLIEVMVAIVIIAVGMLGISKLQTTIIRSGSDAHARSVAATIAQDKIDDLRSFAHLTEANLNGGTPYSWSSTLSKDLMTYTLIENDKGGSIAPGSVDLNKLNLGINVNYNLHWTVHDYYYPDTPALTTASTAVPTLPKAANFKVVTVNVDWLDETGTQQTLSMNTVIDGYAPQFTARYGTVNAGGNSPVIPYTPELAPDVVPVTIDTGTGKKKESSKPLPDVSKKGDSTTVKFETVTYLPNSALSTQYQTAKREDFVNTLCKCTSSGGTPTTSIKLGQTVWDNDLKALKDEVVDKTLTTNIVKSQVDNSGGEAQAAECTICCRDSADNTSSFKACRLKRIDGVLRLYEPWQMIAFNIIPTSYFNTGGSDSPTSLSAMTNTLQTENIKRYSDYVISRVRAALAQWQADGSDTPVTVDTNFKTYSNTGSGDFVNGTIDHKLFKVGSLNYRDMQVRVVYLDYPPTDIYEAGKYTAANVPLDRVAFYENNFTQLAGWIPDVSVGMSGNGAGDQSFDSDYTDNHDAVDSSCVVKTTPNSGRNYVTNEQFYNGSGGTTTDCPNASRGAFYPIVTTSSMTGGVQTVSARMFDGNDGVLDTHVDTTASAATATIDLTVQP